MPTANIFRSLLKQVRSGEVPEEVVDDAVRRMVRKKLQYKLDKPSAVDESVIASDEHLALAREAAVRGSVLLKNDSNALPLDRSMLTCIAVVGDLQMRSTSETTAAVAFVPLSW